MRLILVSTFFIAGASTTSDLEYEAELRHSLKKIQAEAEVLAEKHNVTNPDRMVPVIQPRRSLWKNHQGVGFFELLHNNFWVEKVGNGGANLFITSANQKEYVELLRTDKSKTRVRLYADRCDVKLPQSKTFSTFYKGKWVVE